MISFRVEEWSATHGWVTEACSCREDIAMLALNALLDDARNAGCKYRIVKTIDMEIITRTAKEVCA